MQIVPQEDISIKMQMFADEWMTGEHTGKRGNYVKAAEYAGYTISPSNPSSVGYKLLRHPKVKAYIAKRMEEMSMSAKEVMLRVSEIARSEPGDIVKLSPSGNSLMIDPQAVIDNKRFIKSFTFDSNGNPKVEFHDASQALALMAKLRGMVKDSMELTGPGGGPIQAHMTVQFVMPDGTTHGIVPGSNAALPPGPAEPEEDFSDIEADGEFPLIPPGLGRED